MSSKVVRILVFFVATALAEKTLKGIYSDLLEAEETVPRKVSGSGEHVSHHLAHFHDGENPVHYNITIGDKERFLILDPVEHFIAPWLIIERHKQNRHTRSKVKRESINCHYQGKIHGEPDSRVALSACHGLAGMIDSQGKKFWIEPSHHASGVDTGHKHLIYRRSAVSDGVRKRRKRKKRKHAKNCGTREPRKMKQVEWQQQFGKVTVQERRANKKNRAKKSKLTKRSVSKPRYVETLLVADQSMMEFHDEGDVEMYLLTIMNMVSSLYLDPSIGNLIKVVVVKIILIDDLITEPELNVTINADTTLKNFCKWQKNLNPKNDSHPNHHDVAILITRKDICARFNTPCNTLGVAHIAGMCDSSRSCSVNEDNGITLAHTIAHEMGHNFGMYHDTDKIGCRGKDGKKLHIMTPSFEADTIEVSWSRCSRRDVTFFLDKGLGECLQDEPNEIENYNYPELPPGAMYNADYQCRLQFGGDAKLCTDLGEICNRLWCDVNGTCTTLLRPAAPGTHCGKHKWCQEQKCVGIVDPPVPIDGGWGEWSSWSECTRTCGAGVSIMRRECDHPPPAAGGRFCVGERTRYRVCNINECPENEPSFRAIQCSSYNNHTHNGNKYEWFPYFDQDEPCELYCSDVNDTVIVPWGEYALDGTPCNVGSRDVCISGICKKVGCDWVVDSSAKEDVCGICQGDGSKCDQFQGIYEKQSSESGYREIIVIPSGARNIKVEEMANTANYLSISNVFSKQFYLNGKRQITLAGEYNIAGAPALYERNGEKEKIRIPGPIKESIIIYVIFRDKEHNPGVKYQYTIAKRGPPKTVKYSWILGDWSQCSATCSGGIQHRLPLCQESVSTPPNVVDGTSIVVDESLCVGEERPEQLMRVCNMETCPSHWWIGPWQSCPVTCSEKREKQMRRRSVMCVDGNETALPDHYCDGSTRPNEYEPCIQLPPCSEDR